MRRIQGHVRVVEETKRAVREAAIPEKTRVGMTGVIAAARPTVTRAAGDPIVARRNETKKEVET